MRNQSHTVNKQKLRKKTGIQTFELAFGALFIILMTMLALDLMIPMIADSVLDRATRDAARAAAGQGDQATAVKAAQAALASHKTDGNYVSQPILTSTTPPDFVYQNYGGDPTQGNPYVQVTCSLIAKLPCNIQMFGEHFSGPFTFKRSYQFPIIKFQLGTNFQ